MTKKLLLALDDYIYKFKGKYYAQNQEKFDFYQRYLRAFERLKLVARCQDEYKLKASRVLLVDSRIEVCPITMFQGPMQYARHYLEVKSQMKEIANGCDAAVLRLPSTVAMNAYKCVREKNIPYATEIVYDAHDGYKNADNFIHGIFWKVIDKRMRNICYNADGVSCVTAHYLQQHYFTKKAKGFMANYSSVSLDKSFYFGARMYPKHNVFKIAHVANQVSYKGRKGHYEIIQMIALLKQKGYNVEINFVGADYFGGIKKLKLFAKHLEVENNVKFLGFLSRQQLRDYLMNSDVFVLPTKAEGLPRVIIEAMATGLPCISTNVSGNPELLPPNFLVDDFGDYALMASLVEKLINNKNLYENVSKDNYDKSLEYEASILEKRRDGFYQNLKDRTLPQFGGGKIVGVYPIWFEERRAA